MAKKKVQDPSAGDVVTDAVSISQAKLDELEKKAQERDGAVRGMNEGNEALNQLRREVAEVRQAQGQVPEPSTPEEPEGPAFETDPDLQSLLSVDPMGAAGAGGFPAGPDPVLQMLARKVDGLQRQVGEHFDLLKGMGTNLDTLNEGSEQLTRQSEYETALYGAEDAVKEAGIPEDSKFFAKAVRDVMDAQSGALRESRSFDPNAAAKEAHGFYAEYLPKDEVEPKEEPGETPDEETPPEPPEGPEPTGDEEQFTVPEGPDMSTPAGVGKALDRQPPG